MKRVILLGIGIVFLIGDSLFGSHVLVARWKTAWIMTVDKVMAVPETSGKVIWQSVSGVTPATALIQSLEKENRELAIKVAQLSPFGASASARIAEPTIKAPLSFAGGQWIFLAGSDAGVKVSGLVLIDGTVLGTIRSVHRSYAEVETLSLRAVPLLVQHRQSTQTGIFSVEDNHFVVQFPEKISSIAPLDVLLSVPDGATTRTSYPVAIVESVSTGSAQTTTSVRVKLLARPVVGLEAAVIAEP